MGIEDIIKIFVFLLGTALQISVLVLIAKRKGNKNREIVFALFTFSVLCWCCGIFISLFCRYLYRSINPIEQILGAFAIFNFTLIFPLLVHTLINFTEQKYARFPVLLKYLSLVILYLPTAVFVHPIWKSFGEPTSIFEILENFTAIFVPWVFILLTSAWYIIMRLCRDAEEPEERSFLGIVGWEITLLICLYFVAFVLNLRSTYVIGSYLLLGTDTLTFLLPPLLAYYLYCYNYMEYVFKRGLIYCLLGIAVIALYIFVIRPSGAVMEHRFQINFRMVEGILIMALVFFFDPVKRGLQELSNYIFFREKQYYRKVFSDISLLINQAPHMDLETSLDYVAHTISRAMHIRETSFIFFSWQKGKLQITESTLYVSPEDIENIVRYIEQRRLQVLKIYDLEEHETEILREMRKIKAFTIIALYNESTLIGILNVGKRRRIRHQLLAEEEEMLLMLVNQMVTAIQNTRLAREKFDMERRMYENERLSSLGRLSASIAHEVKNPLSSIKTITQVMKEELPADDPNQEGLGLIVGEIDRLSRVVKQLLRFARPKHGDMRKVNLVDVLKNVLLLLKHEASRNGVNIENRIASEELWLVSNHDALSEIFFNLILNSIQALPKGGTCSIEQSIEDSQDKEEPPFLKIRIADNGPGIVAENRNKIFEPFYTTKQTGTGLGLAIVRNRIRKLHGRIELQNNDPGAVFGIYLPLQQAEQIEVDNPRISLPK